MTINIRKMLEDGHANRAANRDPGDPNAYRVGSSGAVCTDGQIRGVCPRVALLRSLGVEEKPSLATRNMWLHGEASEWVWEQVLTAAGVEFDMQREVTWMIGDIKVTGHPDLVVKQEGQEYGIELKGVFSYNTASAVFLDNRPKNENVIQALAYSLALNLPWSLVYTSPSYWSVPFWDKKKTTLKSLPPFYKIFDLRWDENDAAQYKSEDGEWVTTLVTKEGIREYYQLLHEMKTKKELGPRPTAHYIDGTEEKWGGDACTFCPFKKACDHWDSNKDYDVWLEMCKAAVE